MRCKLYQKRSTGKTTAFQTLAIEKDIFSELNRCIFQMSLKYIKLVIPKMLFILALCSFNFYFKIRRPPPPPTNQKKNLSPPPPPPQAKTFLKFLQIFTPSPSQARGRGVACPLYACLGTIGTASLLSFDYPMTFIIITNVWDNLLMISWRRGDIRQNFLNIPIL